MARPPFRADAPITRNEAVARIAERVCLPGETEREARNRVSHLISYAVKRRKLAKSSHGFFVFGDLAAWARNKWPGKFDDWPCTLSVKPANFEMRMSISAALVLPGSLDCCHDMILSQHKKIIRLQKSLKAAQREIERLKPDAEQYRKIRQKNKDSASRPRK